MSLVDERYGKGSRERFREVLHACQPGGGLVLHEDTTERGGIILRALWGPLEPAPDERPFTDELVFEALGTTFYILFNSAQCGGSTNPELNAKLVELLPPFGRSLGFERVVIENPLDTTFDDIARTGGYEPRTYDQTPEGVDVRGEGHFFVWEL